jgi:hypothetical protein
VHPGRSIRALSTLIVLLCPAVARAYCLTTTVTEPDDWEPTLTGCWKQGVTLGWPARPIGYHLDPRASRKVSFEVFQRITTASFAEWSAVTCGTTNPSFEVRDLGPATIDVSDCQDGPCVRDRLAESGAIVFRDDGWPHDDGSSTFALTTVTYRPSTGRIWGAFLELNTADHDFVEHGPSPGHTAALDSVITHEAGHFLGIAHSDQHDSIMFSRYVNDGNATLREDDRAAICAIRPAPDEPSVDEGCSCGVPRSSPRGAFMIAIAAMVLWSRRRSK